MLTTVLTSNIVNWLLHIINLYMKLSCLPYVLSFTASFTVQVQLRMHVQKFVYFYSE